jgi:hypothetical protein
VGGGVGGGGVGGGGWGGGGCWLSGWAFSGCRVVPVGETDMTQRVVAFHLTDI